MPTIIHGFASTAQFTRMRYFESILNGNHRNNVITSNKSIGQYIYLSGIK